MFHEHWFPSTLNISWSQEICELTYHPLWTWWYQVQHSLTVQKVPWGSPPPTSWLCQCPLVQHHLQVVMEIMLPFPTALLPHPPLQPHPSPTVTPTSFCHSHSLCQVGNKKSVHNESRSVLNGRQARSQRITICLCAVHKLYMYARQVTLISRPVSLTKLRVAWTWGHSSVVLLSCKLASWPTLHETGTFFMALAKLVSSLKVESLVSTVLITCHSTKEEQWSEQ